MDVDVDMDMQPPLASKLGARHGQTEPFPLSVYYPKEHVSTHGAKIVSLHAGPAPASGEMSHEGRDDDSLMLLARGGVTAAFEVLVRRHQGRALRVAGRYLGDPYAARDVVQNAFIAVYRLLPQYQPRGRFSSYLLAVLLNQCRLEVRRRGHVRLVETAELGPLSSGYDESILARERARELDRALGRLSAKVREVVILRFAAGLSHQEIAEILAIPVGTAKRRLFDGLEKLRAILGKD